MTNCSAARKAYALSITLWIVAALTAGSATALYFVKNGVRTAAAVEQKLRALNRAESAFELLKFYLKNGSYRDDYVTFDMPETPTYAFAPKLFLDGRQQRIGEGVTATLQDTGALFCVLYPESALAKLAAGKEAGRAGVLEASLRDWIDKDDSQRINGAERSYYARKRSAMPRNGYSPQSSEELRLVRGFAELETAQWEQLARYLYYGQSVLKNVMTMDLPSLQATLSLSEMQARSLIALRGEDTEAFKREIARVNGYDEDVFAFRPTGEVRLSIVAGEGEAVGRIDAVVNLNFAFDHEITVEQYAAY